MGREDDYTPDIVARLLGLYDDWAARGDRHTTVLDLLSWARDPGGMALRDETDIDGWMATRGPLAPDSEAATILYDFMRAASRLSVLEHAVLALTLCEFSEAEISEVLRDKGNDRGGYRVSRQRVSRILNGRPKRDATGAKVVDEDGFTVYTGGIVSKMTRNMNGRT